MFCPVQGDPSGPGDPDALGSRFEMQVIGIFSLLFHNLHPVSGFLNHHSLETWKIIQERYRIMTINISWCDFNGCSGSRYWVNATLPDVLRFGVVDQWRWLKPQGDTSNQPKVGCWDIPPKDDRKYPEIQHVFPRYMVKYYVFLFWLVAWKGWFARDFKRLHSGHGQGSSAKADWGAFVTNHTTGDKQITNQTVFSVTRLHTVEVLGGGRLDNDTWTPLNNFGWTYVADSCRFSVAFNQKNEIQTLQQFSVFQLSGGW